jgi:tetratricopeptide (TPR) repeat protein
MRSQLAGRTSLTVGLFLALAASNLAAQSVTVFGSVEEARTCMFAAETAANLRTGSQSDLQTCTVAIQNPKLSRRDRAATYCNRGIVKAAMELHQEAFEDYNAAIDLMPDLPEPYVGRGNVYFIADRLEEAIEDYNQAMGLELGRMHVAFLNRGMAYELQGRLDLAEADFRKALELAPQWSLAQQKLDRVVIKRQGAH